MKNNFVTGDVRVVRHVPSYVTELVACILAVVPCAVSAQTTTAKFPAQRIQMRTAAEVAAVWKNPPAEYGPEPYFGMNGPVTIESLAHDLDTMKSLGFHAVTAQAGGGMSTTYLSPEYFAFFKQFVLEAKKRDMKVWIVDDIGYPSGFGGGIFSDSRGKHDLSMQALSIGQRIPVNAGETLSQPVGPDTIAATAVNLSNQRIAVPISDGKISWTAPADGEWTVELVDHVFRTSPTKSDTNPKHTKDSTQPLEDYMNPAATAAYLEATHDGYYRAMPELFGNTILGFRGDEPDYSIAGLPWTPDFFATFQQRKGYDIRPYLAAILLSQGGGRQRPPARPAAGEPPQSDPAFIPAGPPTPSVTLINGEVRAKADYYDVFSQMFRDGFFKPQGLWCAAHGVSYQVHLNHEEMEMDLTRSEGDFLRDMKYVEEPGIDAIWHQIWTDTISDYPRLASSAAHVYGHPQSFTESFAAYRPAPDVTQARYIINEQLVRGINLVETMFYSATRPASASPEPPRPTPPPARPGAPAMPPRRGGPSEVMRDPAWPALMDSTRRVSYVMSMGRPAASVALYIPSSSMWMGDRNSDTAFVSTERMLSERQIDFDIINQDALATDLKAVPGALESMSGNQYSTVIIPSAEVLTQTELDRLRTLSEGGGKVLFLGRTPPIISGTTILDARAATPADFSFATVETSSQLQPSPTPPAQAPAAPPPPQIVPAVIENALHTVMPTREVTLDTPDPALMVNTRHLQDANVYLFFNEGPNAVTHTVTINPYAICTGACGIYTGTGRADLNQQSISKKPSEPPAFKTWDPATGEVSAMPSAYAKGVWTIRIDLKPYETKLVTLGPIVY
jgi:hypothetical protein